MISLVIIVSTYCMWSTFTSTPGFCITHLLAYFFFNMHMTNCSHHQIVINEHRNHHHNYHQTYTFTIALCCYIKSDERGQYFSSRFISSTTTLVHMFFRITSALCGVQFHFVPWNLIHLLLRQRVILADNHESLCSPLCAYHFFSSREVNTWSHLTVHAEWSSNLSTSAVSPLTRNGFCSPLSYSQATPSI